MPSPVAGRVTVQHGKHRAPYMMIGCANMFEPGQKLIRESFTIDGDIVTIKLRKVNSFPRSLAWKQEQP